MRPYALQDIVERFSKYPAEVHAAVTRANTHPDIVSATTGSTRKVLSWLLARASKDNGLRALKARVDRLAQEAEVSEKTVQRAIAAFRELGWLAVPTEESRTEMGLYSHRTYFFTPGFCRLVGLPCPGETPEETCRETKMSDGGVYVDLTFKEDQREIQVQNLKGKPVTLPAELEQACEEFQVRPTGMAKLRGIARMAGHQLEAIITVARDYLRKAGATGNRAYRYLEAMATRQTDYAARAAQAARIAAETSLQQTTRTMDERCRERKFVGPNGFRVKFFANGAAEVFTGTRFLTVAGEGLREVYDRIESGWLRPVVE